jgi:hypothetical protein
MAAEEGFVRATEARARAMAAEDSRYFHGSVDNQRTTLEAVGVRLFVIPSHGCEEARRSRGEAILLELRPRSPI